MYSTLEKVKIVEFYVATNLVLTTQPNFFSTINVRRLPLSKTIKSIVAKFKTKGSVLAKEASGEPNECLTVQNIETFSLSVIEDPKKNYRKQTQVLNMKPTSPGTTEKRFKINSV